MLKRIDSLVRRLFSSRDGAVAIQIGIGLVALTGMTGLGAETTFIYYKHRQMQSASDAASLSGAVALIAESSAETEARAVAARMGFTHGVDGVTVTVNVPPTSGPNAGAANAVEVRISQPQNMAIMGAMLMRTLEVGARSVAKPLGAGGGESQSEGQFCVLALDPNASQAVYLSNNAAIGSEHCGVAANSTHNTALVINNNASIRGPVKVSGGASVGNNGSPPTSQMTLHAPTTVDPYADVLPETPPACTGQSGSGSNNITRNLTPGHFCSGWDFKNNVVLNLASGTYYIDSKMSIKNNVVINGTGGVTIVINGTYAIDIANNATLNMNAPNSGNYAGLTFFGTRGSTPSVVQKFSNNTVMNLQGAVYFPSQTLEFDNNGSTHSTSCTHLVAGKIKFMNNATLGNDCDNTGVKPISPPVEIVENVESVELVE